MITSSGIKVLEYNMRFGDPETQAIMMHLDSDLLGIFNMAIEKKLSEVDLSWKSGTSACIVVASSGYPENPLKGSEILNIETVLEEYDVNCFYAGVKKSGDKLISDGGRVLSVCKNAQNPYPDLYNAIDRINFKDKYYRKDIGG